MYINLISVDDALVADGDDSASLEDREKALLELLDKANMIRHHVARIKRVKLIRYFEICLFNRTDNLLARIFESYKYDLRRSAI